MGGIMTAFATFAMLASMTTQEAIVTLLNSPTSCSPSKFAEAREQVFRDAQDGHPLRVYYPRNATAKLFIGMRPTPDTASILSFQAADIRADNQQIVGAFVENGNVHSKGLSKRGYCGIIDGQITIGVADDSPLYDQAIATGGYFFRQYPLVENGQTAPSQLKSESIRRGLCDVGGRIVVIESATPILFYEFGETLSHLGVWNAIYLIGGGALGSATTLDGEQISWGTPLKEVPESINYICWK